MENIKNQLELFDLEFKKEEIPDNQNNDCGAVKEILHFSTKCVEISLSDYQRKKELERFHENVKKLTAHLL